MGGTICKQRRDEQVGRAILWLPWFFVNQYLEAVDRTEDKLGRPPTQVEIFVLLNMEFNLPIKNVFESTAVTGSLLREDLLYTNETGS